MGNTWTIYRREIKSYFTSPIAYIFICAFLVVMAILFFLYGNFFRQPRPDTRSYFFWLPFTYALLIPAITMRLWSEEKRSGTVEALMTLPFKSWQVVLGKYLAGYTVMLLTLVLTAIVPYSVSFVLDLDSGVVLASYVGAVLLAGVYVAVGSWTSALTQNQIVAFLGAMVILFALAALGYPDVVDWGNKFVSGLGSALGWFGTFYQYTDFTKGIVNPVGIVYSVSMIVFFLVLNHFAVEWRKY